MVSFNHFNPSGLYITLKIIFPPPPFGDHIFYPYIYLQVCRNKHIFDHFVLVFEQIVSINVHFLSTSALSGGGGLKLK